MSRSFEVASHWATMQRRHRIRLSRACMMEIKRSCPRSLETRSLQVCANNSLNKIRLIILVVACNER